MDYNHHVRNLKYYPISLDITDKRCLVVGGGSVGARKAVTLARCGAVVTVISPIFVDQFIEIEKYSFARPVSCIKKKYDSTDLDQGEAFSFQLYGIPAESTGHWHTFWQFNPSPNETIMITGDSRNVINFASFPHSITLTHLVISKDTDSNSTIRMNIYQKIVKKNVQELLIDDTIEEYKLLIAPNVELKSNEKSKAISIDNTIFPKIAVGEGRGLQIVVEKIGSISNEIYIHAICKLG